MSPLLGVFLLIALGAICLIVEGAWRTSYRPLPPQGVHEMAPLVALGLLVALNSVVLLSTLGPVSSTICSSYELVVALALLAAMYRPRQS